MYFLSYCLTVVFSLIMTWAQHAPRADDPGLIHDAIYKLKMMPDWSPIYKYFAKYLHFFVDSEFVIYQIMFAVIVIWLALVSYLVIYLLTKSSRTTFLLSLVLLFSPVSPLIGSYATIPSSIAIYYAMTFYFLGIAIMYYFKQSIYSFYAILFFAIASLLRPEFIYAVPLFFLYVFGCAYFDGDRRKMNMSEIGTVLFCIVGVVTLYCALGLPVTYSKRSLLAFGQHFSLRYCETYKNLCVDIDPWLRWKDIMKYSFSNYANIASLFFSNPNAVIAHVSTNIFQGILSIVSLGYFIPVFIFKVFLNKVVGLILGVIAMLVVFRQVWLYKKTMFFINEPRIFLFMLFSCSPFLMVSFLLFPRIHYLAFCVYALLVFIVPVKYRDCNVQSFVASN